MVRRSSAIINCVMLFWYEKKKVLGRKMHANENISPALRISITLDYLVTVDRNRETKRELERDVLFRLSYDKAEIPVSGRTLAKVLQDLEAPLPEHTTLNRISGALLMNRSIIKKFVSSLFSTFLMMEISITKTN